MFGVHACAGSGHVWVADVWGACMCGQLACVGSRHVWGTRMCLPVCGEHMKRRENSVRDYANLKAHMHFFSLSFYLIHIQKVLEWKYNPAPPRITDGSCSSRLPKESQTPV